MERPWLILCRVVQVNRDDDDLHADEEDPVVIDPGADDAQAQEEQHAGFGEAEDPVAAVEAAVEAHDAVAEAEADAQAQEEEHAAAAEAQAGEADAQAQEEQHAGVGVGVGEAEVHFDVVAAFTVTFAPPPSVSYLVAGLGSQPNPKRPDMYPYMIATGRFCLLVPFAIAPSYGANFSQQPNHSRLVVVRHFVRHQEGAEITACAAHIPGNPYHEFLNMPALRNIESIGLVCHQETGHFLIAELIVTTGSPQAIVVLIRSDIAFWQANYFYYDNPLFLEDRHRDWVPHGTAAINSTVLWFDLSWGIISYDLTQPPLHHALNFHRLPPGRVLRAGAGVPDIHCRRCIAVSESLVRYVEIILHDPHQATTVNMWYRDLEDPNGWIWQSNYSVSFENIWADESYAQTGLPPNPPMLVGVSPANSSVVYFSLNQRLFGVNVPEHTVVDCQEYEPLNRPGPRDEPVTSRYLIAWNLDADAAPNVGHQPDEPSDHGDSSPNGPADEGEIDYETPPE